MYFPVFSFSVLHRVVKFVHVEHPYVIHDQLQLTLKL